MWTVCNYLLISGLLLLLSVFVWPDPQGEMLGIATAVFTG